MTTIQDRDFQAALAETLVHEGGWSDHPDDPGGKTFRGVTKKAWENYVGRKVSAEELKSLTFDQIAKFYKTGYWDTVRASELPQGLNSLIFDISVNSGPKRAIIILQDSLNHLTRVNLVKDGIIGRKTLAAATNVDVFDLIDRVAWRRLTFYSRLRNWQSFKNGWRRRAVESATFANRLALGHAESVILAEHEYE